MVSKGALTSVTPGGDRNGRMLMIILEFIRLIDSYGFKQFMFSQTATVTLLLGQALRRVRCYRNCWKLGS